MEKTTKKIVPNLPGVYLFKDAQGTVIYIGKAKSLKKRVQSYFQPSPILLRQGSGGQGWKISELMAAYHDLDFIITHSETEAMLLEAELIQKYKPRFNQLFKDGQPFVYLLFTAQELPTLKVVRNKKEKGIYFGPFLHKTHARNAYRFLMHTFKLNICNKKLEHGCLDYHLGTCPGTCMSIFDPQDYRFRMELAMDVLRNKHDEFVAKIKEKITGYNKTMEFEKSKRLNEYLSGIETIFETIHTRYSVTKFATDILVATSPTPYTAHEIDAAHKELQDLVGTQNTIRSIDCFDISHFQSRFIVGSCVRFIDGKPDKAKFRRFTVRSLTEQNDYAALQEIVSRRYRDAQDFPDLILIDGGKGQLSAVAPLVGNVPLTSLAKREERLFTARHPEGTPLTTATPVGRLIIAIRDYAHHFAIKYHRLKRSKAL